MTPHYADAYFNRGNSYAQQQKYDLAIADYERAIEIDPDDSNAYYNRGCYYFQRKEYDLAIADFNRTIKLDSHDADAYFERGNTYAKLGKYNLAKTDREKAKRLFIDQENTVKVKEIERILKTLASPQKDPR